MPNARVQLWNNFSIIRKMRSCAWVYQSRVHVSRTIPSKIPNCFYLNKRTSRLEVSAPAIFVGSASWFSWVMLGPQPVRKLAEPGSGLEIKNKARAYCYKTKRKIIEFYLNVKELNYIKFQVAAIVAYRHIWKSTGYEYRSRGIGYS